MHVYIAHIQTHICINISYNAKNIRTTLVCPGHLQTKMFDGVRIKYPFITPTLAPLDLVKKIITSLDKNQGQDILTPYYVNLVPILKTLPNFIHDLVHKV